MLTLYILFKVDACFILENCHPVFSDKGSVKYTKEVNVMNFFQDFLQEVEDRGMYYHNSTTYLVE